MGADWETFAIRFKEHDPAENWEERLLEIADRIKSFHPPCGNPFNYPDVFNIDREKKYCEMIRYVEVYGRIDVMYDTIVEFLIRKFPSLDFEFHQLEKYGDIGGPITIVEDGSKFSCGVSLFSDDEEDEQENPYHISKSIWPVVEDNIEEAAKDPDFVEETAFLYWFCDQFK